MGDVLLVFERIVKFVQVVYALLIIFLFSIKIKYFSIDGVLEQITELHLHLGLGTCVAQTRANAPAVEIRRLHDSYLLLL